MTFAHHPRRRRRLVILLVLLILAEISLTINNHKGHLPIGYNAAALVLVSCLIGLVPAWWFFKKNITTAELSPRLSYAPFVLFCAAIIPLAWILRGIFHRIPVAQRISDIIPTLEIAVRRFLEGTYPYQKIFAWGYELPLTYLPLQWGPYIPAELLHFDYRWIAFGIWCLGAVYVLRQKPYPAGWNGVVIAALLITGIGFIIRFEESIVAATIELMVAGYYMLFTRSIVSRSHPYLKGFFISLCLLSRYSLVLWLPLWLVAEWLSGDRKNLLKTCAAIAAAVLLLYVLPFLSRDWTIFSQGYHYYTNAALGEWQNLNELQQPYHLYSGHGFARYFYERTSYPLEQRLSMLQRAHQLICIGSTIIMGIWYYLNRRNIDLRVFLLCSFKIYLTLFLAFIQVPYTYLMITGIFVSIAMLAFFINLKAQPYQNQ